jgi:putative hemolysin
MTKVIQSLLDRSRDFLDIEQPSGVKVVVAKAEHHIAAAQALRYRLFREEFGANIMSDIGHDQDFFDPFCKHLVAIDALTQDVVGTYRILNADDAARAGSFYCEEFFDLGLFNQYRHKMLELGRGCIDFEFRDGVVLRKLWRGIAQYLQNRPEEWVLGCVSVSTRDGGHYAASLFNQLWDGHRTAIDYAVVPKTPLPMESLYQRCPVVVPPLMRSYLKMGGRLLGRPSLDPIFQVADFPVCISKQIVLQKLGVRSF